ncbi:CHRD domain-containing protein [Salinigranum sp.]|uniref:CHRD domain-containing protein n=1 Tax=Salinigranum sp. TaxID=1966351 RepID=UPI003562C231
MGTRRGFLKTVGVGTVAAAGLTTMAAADEDENEDAVLFTPLTSGQTVPKVRSRATGMVDFTDDGGVLTFEMTLKNIEGVTQAHIHAGGRGETGGVVFPLIAFNTKLDGSGSGDPQSGTPQHPLRVTGDIGSTSVSPVEDLVTNPTRYYVNVHAVENPSGEVRGQIREP